MSFVDALKERKRKRYRGGKPAPETRQESGTAAFRLALAVRRPSSMGETEGSDTRRPKAEQPALGRRADVSAPAAGRSGSTCRHHSDCSTVAIMDLLQRSNCQCHLRKPELLAVKAKLRLDQRNIYCLDRDTAQMGWSGPPRFFDPDPRHLTGKQLAPRNQQLKRAMLRRPRQPRVPLNRGDPMRMYLTTYP